MAESIRCNEVLSESGTHTAASHFGALPVTTSVRAERCFVTNEHSNGIKHITYLVDARPSPNEESPEDKARKKIVVDGLKVLGVVPSTFHLEHKSNQIMLSTSIKISMETYGFCAIVPSKECLLRMTELVMASNAIWAKDKQKDPNCCRKPFNLLDAALLNPEYQLLVLHPHRMFQGSHLTVYWDRDGASVDGPMNYTKYYFIDGAMRVITNPLTPPSNGESCDVAPPASRSSPPMLGPFHRRHNREDPSHNSNPFLHVLSAHTILLQYEKALVAEEHPVALCPEYEELIELTCQLANLIYFQVDRDVEAESAQAQMDS